MPKTYSWKATSGVWTAPANWVDLTLLKDPALTPPGATDTALIPGSTFRQLAGGGVAGPTTFSGSIDLAGSYTLSTLSADLLDIRAGRTLAIGSGYLNIAAVSGAGASFTVSGTLSAGALAIADGATITVGGLTLRAFSQGIFPSGALRIDTASALVVGTPTTATAGKVTLNGGTIDASGIVFDAPVSGTGTIVATTIAGAIPAGVTVAMSFGYLGVNPSSITLPLAGFEGTLVGLPGTTNTSNAAYNTYLATPGHSVTGASYSPGAGTLALTGDAGTIETIHLAGNYAQTNFIAVPIVQSGTGFSRIYPTDLVLAAGTAEGFDTLGAPAILTGAHVVAGVSLRADSAIVGIQPGATLAGDDINVTRGAIAVSGPGATLRADGTISLGYIQAFIHGVGTSETSLSVLNGGTAQSFFSVFLKNSDALIFVDAHSSFEAGEIGGAAIGAFTIDETIPVAGVGTIDATVVNNGSIIARAGTYEVAALTVTGPITGSGELQIDPGATLALRGAVAATETIEFTGPGGVLDISLGAPVAAAITGFAPTDTIRLPSAVTGASLAAGTIALTGAEGATIAHLSVPNGLAANQSLLMLPGAPSTLVLANGTLLSGAAPTPSAGNPQPTALSWVGTGGAWGDTANWIDVATSLAPAAAPGFGDAVLVGATATPLQVISGAGNAGILQINSSVAFSGIFNTVSLTVGAGTMLTTAVTAGSTLTAQVARMEWRFAVTGIGASFAVAGAYTMFGPTGLEVTNGGKVTIGAIATQNTGSFSQSITVDALSSMEIGATGNAPQGFLTVDAGATLGAGTSVQARVNNNGTIANLATIDGDVTGTGHIILAPGGRLAITGAIAPGQTIDFAAGAETLTLAAGAAPGLITGFAAGDLIAFAGASFDAAAYTPTGANLGTLALTQRGTLVQSLTLQGNYAGQIFLANPSDTATTSIALAAAAIACFTAGTRIRTPGGEAPVEQLRPGDVVLTAAGRPAPIAWIGHRQLDTRRHRRPDDVQPIRVAAHAFAPNQPARDLCLSPDHAVCHGGVLIPVRYLVNGRTITRQRVPAITYFHIELDRHDVILAEDLPCESYLDTGNRSAFANGGPAIALHPDFARAVWSAAACAPLALAGPAVIAARTHLHARATALGHAITDAPALTIHAAGRRLPIHSDGARHRIRLPQGAGPIRLRSRRWTPAEMRPDETDARPLGVALANITGDGRPIALDDPRLSSGWHQPEPGWRWTTGNAGLALAGVTELGFDLALTGTYRRR